MTEEAFTVRGGCQCGAVRYEARAVSTDAYYCHCRMCQRAFGHLSGIFFEVDVRSVRWEKGEPAYYHSSKVARRGFCRECGTPLTFEYLDLEEVHLAVGSLDEPWRFRPVAHYGSEGIVEPFFTDDGLPRERTDEDEEFMVRWRAAYGPGSRRGPSPVAEEAAGWMPDSSPPVIPCCTTWPRTGAGKESRGSGS